jgi:glycosyltransferase involved in cell wall biosynthesis
MPKVSVIIPCFNSQNTIQETIESVLAQTMQDFELIVVDDGSTDDTKQILSDFGNRVKYLYRENGGQSAARNTGIRAAIGEFVAFVDSDDLWCPDKLEKQIRILEDTTVDWCYCDCLYFCNSDSTSLGKHSDLFYPAKEGWIAKSLLLGNCIASPTPLIRRSIFDQCGLFDESPLFRIGEDWEMWLRIAAQYPVGYRAEVLAKHREHTFSLSFGADPMTALASHLAVIEKITALYPQDLMPIKEKAMAFYAARFSKSAWLNGNIVNAKELIQQAESLDPWNFRYRFYQFLYHLPIGMVKNGLILRNWMRRP